MHWESGRHLRRIQLQLKLMRSRVKMMQTLKQPGPLGNGRTNHHSALTGGIGAAGTGRRPYRPIVHLIGAVAVEAARGGNDRRHLDDLIPY